MTTLICTGTLFSEWQHVLESQVPGAASRLPAQAELNSYSEALCQQQYPETDELTWKSFSPDEKDTDNARQLFSAINSESLFIWADANSSLYLDLWLSIDSDSRFIMFYANPEYELSNYINTHNFNTRDIEKVISAWTTRTRAMFTFFMNNRGRCLLVNVQDANSDGRLLVKLLNEKFGFDLQTDSPDAGEEAENFALLDFLATTLLLNDDSVSELFDEVRSVATVISRQDKAIADIQVRNRSLINTFLDEVTEFKRVTKSQKALKNEQSLNHLQISQLVEELEFYFKKCKEQENVNNTFAKYLSNDPLLKLARHARRMQ